MSFRCLPCLTELSPFKVILCAVILPRLLVLGDYPHMDEGYYIYYAQLIFQNLLTHGQLPDVGSCNLYSCLLAPFCALPGNLYLWMRLVDLGFAIISAWLLCQVLVRESASKTHGLLIALLCLLCWHVPDVLDAGVKNSLSIAYAVLFWGLLLVARKTQAAWFTAGCLTALAVLLREPFAIYACLGALTMWLAYGFFAACLYCLGGIMTGLGLIFAMALGRGSLQGLISAYLQAGTVVSAESGKILGNICQYSLRFLWEFWPFLLLTIFAFTVLWRAENRRYWQRALFWLVCSLAPLVEIVSKMAFLYHFSMLFPAFAGMLALSFRLKQDPAFLQRVLNVRMLLLASLIVLCVNYRPVALQETGKVLHDFPECRWSKEVSEQSNTLLAGKVIEALPGRTLSVSGFMFFLYPLTRRLPPCLGMDDLSRVFLHLGCDTQKLSEFLAAHAADVIVVGKVQEANHVAMFTEDIQRAVAVSGLYTLVADIPVDEEKNYGWIGCFIYQKIQ